MTRIQKLFSRSEGLYREPERPDQTLKEFADRIVIIDNRNKREIDN